MEMMVPRFNGKDFGRISTYVVEYKIVSARGFSKPLFRNQSPCPRPIPARRPPPDRCGDEGSTVFRYLNGDRPDSACPRESGSCGRCRTSFVMTSRALTRQEAGGPTRKQPGGNPRERPREQPRIQRTRRWLPSGGHAEYLVSFEIRNAEPTSTTTPAVHAERGGKRRAISPCTPAGSMCLRD
jgi:hypothetical protein